MYFDEIKKYNFISLKKIYSLKDLGIFDKGENLKIQFYKLNNLSYVDEISVYNWNNSNLKRDINLSEGKYALVYKSGALAKEDGYITWDIKTSLGEFKVFDESSNILHKNYNLDDDSVFKYADENISLNGNIFEFEITSDSEFTLWCENAKCGGIIFELLKFNDDAKISSTPTYEFSSNNTIEIDQNYKYYVSISKLNEDIEQLLKPTKIIPSGEFSNVIYTKIAKVINTNEFENIVENDYNSLSTNNISIPQNVHPLSKYKLIGKLSLTAYLDMLNNEVYIIPNDYPKCFISLNIPDGKCEIIEEDDKHKLIYITEYTFLNSSIKNDTLNKECIRRWTSCNESEICKESDIFYYVNSYEKYKEYYNNSYIIDILDKNCVFINITYVNAIASDDVSKSSSLSSIIADCSWVKTTSAYITDNKIEWGEQSNWQNIDYNVDNIISSEISGNGVLKISESLFSSLISSYPIPEYGSLSNEQLKNIGVFNEPTFKEYPRFPITLASQNLTDDSINSAPYVNSYTINNVIYANGISGYYYNATSELVNIDNPAILSGDSLLITSNKTSEILSDAFLVKLQGISNYTYTKANNMVKIDNTAILLGDTLIILSSSIYQ